MAVLHKIHTFIRHCSSPLFHDIGLFVEQLQQAVADQEKKIIEQQKVLRQQQALAAARAAAEAGEDVSMTEGRVGGKQKAGEEDLNGTPAKRPRSTSPDSQAQPRSSSSPDPSPEIQPELAAQGRTDPQDSILPQTESDAAPVQAKPAISLDLDQPVSTHMNGQTPVHSTNGISAVNSQSDIYAADDSSRQDAADMTSAKADAGAVTKAAEEAAQAAAADGAKATGSVMELEDGVQHPLGGPKPDKPKPKRKRYLYNKESTRVYFQHTAPCLLLLH